MPNIGDKRPAPCPLCDAPMTLTRIPERTASFGDGDVPVPAPIPAHNAWVCAECGHEIEE